MATLYLPLRSNARWFRDEATHAAFEARLKTCLVLYDKLFIQDGRYELTFWQDGQHLEWLIPPHMLGGVERRHRFAETGAPMGISLAPKGGNFTPIISGPIESWYSADFKPLLENAGLAEESYIEFSDGDIDDKAKDRESKRAKVDAERTGDAGLPMSSIERSTTLSSLYVDAACAAVLKMPFSCDPRVRRLAEWGMHDRLSRIKSEGRSESYHRWVTLELPDFSRASWAELHGLRESWAGRQFRQILDRTAQTAVIVAADGASEREVADAIDAALLREVSAEALAKLPSLPSIAGTVALDLTLNWLGVAALPAATISALPEIAARLNARREWLSLLSWRPASDWKQPLGLNR